MTRVIGLSGGIGSGKSTVARLFEKLGALVIDADLIVHELQGPGAPLLEDLARAFGADILAADGSLDRPALGAIVFRDAEARRRLNGLVHPKVGLEMLRRLAAAREAGIEVAVLDIPLLFEGLRDGTGTAAMLDFDATVVVYAPESLQIERQMDRDGHDREEALRRLRAQMPLSEKRAMADHVIDNSGSLEETERQVREVFRAISEAPAGEP